jgi:hypothetical protein
MALEFPTCRRGIIAISSSGRPWQSVFLFGDVQVFAWSSQPSSPCFLHFEFMHKEILRLTLLPK